MEVFRQVVAPLAPVDFDRTNAELREIFFHLGHDHGDAFVGAGTLYLQRVSVTEDSAQGWPAEMRIVAGFIIIAI